MQGSEPAHRGLKPHEHGRGCFSNENWLRVLLSSCPDLKKDQLYPTTAFVALEKKQGVPIVAQLVTNLASIHEDEGSIPGLPWWVRVQCCHKLQRRLQMQLGSSVAVAVVEAGHCRSNSTPSLGASICYRCSPKKKERTKQGKKRERRKEGHIHVRHFEDIGEVLAFLFLFGHSSPKPAFPAVTFLAFTLWVLALPFSAEY